MNVGNILSRLNEINQSNLVTVYVPSADKEMTFKPLSVKQQKDLIKSGLDGALAGLTISNVISQIILDNTTEKYEFSVIDKVPIILALRMQSFGPDVKIKEDDKEIEFDLSKILSNNLKFTNTQKTTVSLGESGVKIELEMLSLQDDITINNFQLDKLRKNKQDELSDTVGSLFVYEILKFISKLTVNVDEIDMKTIPLKDRLTIVENIPAVLNNQILEYIQTFRKDEMNFITVDGNTLPIDARLFSKE
jgi:hypothetical protein